ncbi:MAG TPA: glycoside hydrolase family 15 protein [Gammaproteobacteria bacterium]|nr:glycoside hydrolase family 15 protein [Gammaproteobacteria bacterium]
MSDLNLAVIGNCQISALLDARGRIVWSCLPRFDGDPVFNALLAGDADAAGDGFFAVQLTDCVHAEQRYLENTPVVETLLHDSGGAIVRLLDFAPRFNQFGRTFRPVMLARMLEPLQGSPRVRIRLRPSFGYGSASPTRTFGSNHIRYVGPGQALRLTTDASISDVLEEHEFLLERALTLLLGPDETVADSVHRVGRLFFEETCDYWRGWARGLSIPFEWQEPVIRAAITLKMCAYEDTGAVVAAMTTSIPEARHSGRNWDYRYCWLRDAYFVVHALNRLGATRTMEAFLRYIINVSANTDDDHLQPVYGITGDTNLAEIEVGSLRGYRSMGPVRVGNLAYDQVQNDVYGAAVLASTQTFFDRRLTRPGDLSLFERLEAHGRRAEQLYDQPDAGLWEYRDRERVHTFSSVMCWAACDRLARIATRLGVSKKARHWRARADRLRQSIVREAWNDSLRSFTTSFGRTDLDASLLLLHELGFVDPADPRFAGTVAAIEKELRRGPFMFRYVTPDDFGEPETAFSVCTFWYIDALAALGRRDEARELFDNMLACRNPLGLLSEDIDPASRELWGNFPQTYSLVGIINSASRLSTSWESAF